MIFFSQFQKIAETRRQQIFLRIHKVQHSVGTFHIDTIVVKRKNRKVSEPAKKKSREIFRQSGGNNWDYGGIFPFPLRRRGNSRP